MPLSLYSIVKQEIIHNLLEGTKIMFFVHVLELSSKQLGSLTPSFVFKVLLKIMIHPNRLKKVYLLMWLISSVHFQQEKIPSIIEFIKPTAAYASRPSFSVKDEQLNIQ